MLKKSLQIYQKFLDERLGNGTGTVALIALMILSVGISPQISPISYNKANVLEIKNSIQSIEKNIIAIDGRKYEIIFKEIK